MCIRNDHKNGNNPHTLGTQFFLAFHFRQRFLNHRTKQCCNKARRKLQRHPHRIEIPWLRIELFTPGDSCLKFLSQQLTKCCSASAFRSSRCAISSGEKASFSLTARSRTCCCKDSIVVSVSASGTGTGADENDALELTVVAGGVYGTSAA